MLIDSDKYTLIGIKEEMQKLLDSVKEIAERSDSKIQVGVTHLDKGNHYLEITATDYL